MALLLRTLFRLKIFNIMCYGTIFCDSVDPPSVTLKISPQLSVYPIGQSIDLSCHFNSDTPIKTSAVSFYMAKGHRYRGNEIKNTFNVTAADIGSIIYCEVWCSEIKNETRYALTSNEIRLSDSLDYSASQGLPVVMIEKLNSSSLRVGDIIQCYTKYYVDSIEIYRIKGKTKKLLKYNKFTKENIGQYYVHSNIYSGYKYNIFYTLTACENDTKIFCSAFQDLDNFSSSKELHIVMEPTEFVQECDVDSCFRTNLLFNDTKNIVFSISGLLLGIISITLLILLWRRKLLQNSGKEIDGRTCLKNIFKEKSKDLYDKGNIDDKVLYAEIEVCPERSVNTPVMTEQTPYATIVGVMKPKPKNK